MKLTVSFRDENHGCLRFSVNSLAYFWLFYYDVLFRAALILLRHLLWWPKDI